MSGPFDTYEIPDDVLRHQPVSMTQLYQIYYLTNFGHYVEFNGTEAEFAECTDWCLKHCDEHFATRYRTPLPPKAFLTELEYRAEHDNRTRITMADLTFYNVEREIEETSSSYIISFGASPHEDRVVRHVFFLNIRDAVFFKLTWGGK